LDGGYETFLRLMQNGDYAKSSGYYVPEKNFWKK